jgi:hypothetical protein
MPSRELSITWNDIYDLCSAMLDYDSVEQNKIKIMLRMGTLDVVFSAW